jgi:hypothetical protein
VLRYPLAAYELADRIRADDFVDARDQLIWTALCTRHSAGGQRAAADIVAELDVDLAERARTLLQRVERQHELAPARAREEMVETLKNVRRRRDERERAYWYEVLREVDAGGDGPPRDEVLSHLTDLVGAERHHAFYPRPSPYFRDIRTRDP